MKTTLVIGAFVAAAAAAHADPFFVPGNASGYFGRNVDMLVPLVPAVTVDAQTTITITYVDGLVDFGPDEAGPNGGDYFVNVGEQTPLQESQTFPLAEVPTGVNNFAALMGAFVPQYRVDRMGFIAIDSTKLPSISRSGIMPCELFFVGSSIVVHAEGPGTLFLGINDAGTQDNNGGFNVEVTTP